MDQSMWHISNIQPTGKLLEKDKEILLKSQHETGR